MTRDEVLAMAREVGLWEMLEGYSSEYGSLDAEEDCLPNLQRFATLVAAHEREECAKVLETHPSYDFCRCPCECAAAIRGRD